MKTYSKLLEQITGRVNRPADRRIGDIDHEIDQKNTWISKVVDSLEPEDFEDDDERPENFDIVTGKLPSKLGVFPNEKRDPMPVVEQFDTSKLVLNDGSSVKLSPQDATTLNKMFEDHTAKPLRKLMMSNLKEFKSVLSFAKALHEQDATEIKHQVICKCGNKSKSRCTCELSKSGDDD